VACLVVCQGVCPAVPVQERLAQVVLDRVLARLALDRVVLDQVRARVLVKVVPVRVQVQVVLGQVAQGRVLGLGGLARAVRGLVALVQVRDLAVQDQVVQDPEALVQAEPAQVAWEEAVSNKLPARASCR